VRCLQRLGRLAERAGDRAVALTCFKSALALADETALEDQSVSAASAIGALYTQMGEAEQGLDYTLKSTGARLAAGAPPDRTDAANLRRQHGALGSSRFRRLVSNRLHREHAVAILALVAEGSAIAAGSG
jgi:tetratricopeptide (TPR) repeat protein